MNRLNSLSAAGLFFALTPTAYGQARDDDSDPVQLEELPEEEVAPTEPTVDPLTTPAPVAPDQEPASAPETPKADDDAPSSVTQSTPTQPAQVPAGAYPDEPADEQAQALEKRTGRFEFGSYGRINVGTDLEGRVAQDTDIVAHGTRYDQDNYVELEFRREDFIGNMTLREVMTLALAGEFFHFDSEFHEDIALRNLYVSVDNALFEGNELWVGQRMVRGDDIYLLDYWPMDNLNVTGGGVRQTSKNFEAAVTVGLYRPKGDYYYQTDTYQAPVGFLPIEYAALNRPRTVIAGRLVGQTFLDGGAGGKVVAYGEHHSVPAGNRMEEGNIETELPADTGGVLGLQVGVWRAKSKGFINLFGRCALGLAVYDPLFSPFEIGTPTDTSGARDCSLGLASNLELGVVGIQTGGYVRSFRDEQPEVPDNGRFIEGIADIRPYLWIGQKAGVQLDLSYQFHRRAETDSTGQQIAGALGKMAIMPFFSPFGRGTYTRPHLFLAYALTLRDGGARRMYPDEHPYNDRPASHYLGVGAEWWFNSSSY